MKILKNKTRKIGILTAALCACCASAIALSAPSVAASAETVNFAISPTPTVRTAGTGIRFSLSVDNGYFEQLTTQGEYSGYTASVGAVILPTEFLGGAPLAADGVYGTHTPIVAPLTNVDLASCTETTTNYNVVVTDVPYAAYEQELSVRGLIRLTKAGAEDRYVYTDDTAVGSLGATITDAYNAEENVEKKRDIEKLLENAMAGCTIAFDEAEYAMSPPNMEVDFKLFGNKFGFEPSAKWLNDNVVFETGDEGIAKVAGKTILAQGEGETQITARLGEQVLASSTVKVGDYTVTDSTGKFTWEWDKAASVTHGDKTYVNTGIINGTPQNPLTVNGYEVITNGQYAQANGALRLADGVKLIEFAANVLNEKGEPDGNEGHTTTIIDETFKVRLTDVKDPTKVLDFEYLTPGWVTTAFYFGFTYTNGTDTLHIGMEDSTVVYGYGFGNSSHPLSNIPKLVYHGDYQFGFGSGARALADKETGRSLATQLSEDSFGEEGVILSVNTGKKGMMILHLAEPIVPPTPDATGKFSYSHTPSTNVEKTANGYEMTALGGTTISLIDPIELNDPDTDIFQFTTNTPSTTTYVVIRFIDYYDETKGISLAMANAASNDIGWGASGATYIRSGNVNDKFKDDFGYWTAITNDAARLGSGSANMIFRFNASAEKKFSVYLPDLQYYGLKHTGDANPFSAGNTTCKVRVSIEFVNNNQPATLTVSKIGGAL